MFALSLANRFICGVADRSRYKNVLLLPLLLLVGTHFISTEVQFFEV